jgi:hypothetical protein
VFKSGVKGCFLFGGSCHSQLVPCFYRDKMLQSTIQMLKARGVIIPTLAQLINPELTPEPIKEKLKNVGLWGKSFFAFLFMFYLFLQILTQLIFSVSRGKMRPRILVVALRTFQTTLYVLCC